MNFNKFDFIVLNHFYQSKKKNPQPFIYYVPKKFQSFISCNFKPKQKDSRLILKTKIKLK